MLLRILIFYSNKHIGLFLNEKMQPKDRIIVFLYPILLNFGWICDVMDVFPPNVPYPGW